MKETTDKNKLERRIFLKDGNLPEYNKMCQKYSKARQDMRDVVTLEVIKMFGTSDKVYKQASAYYQKNASQAQKLARITKECQVQEKFGGDQNAAALVVDGGGGEDSSAAPLLTRD